MATGFSVGSVDLDALLVKRGDFTGSNLRNKAINSGRLRDTVTHLGGTPASQLRCTNNCSWQCNSWCDAASKRKM